jgi:hypothetical protein
MRNLGKAVYVPWRFVWRLLQLLWIQRIDLIIVEGPLFPYTGLAFERMLARRCPLIIEFDDAIYLTPGLETIMPALLELSSGAIVGNNTLARYARAFTANVTIVPTVVDTDRFIPAQPRAPLRERSAGEAVTIVWIGLDYNVPHLKSLAPVFRRIQAAHNVRIKIVSGTAPRLDGVRIEFCRWEYETEVDHLQSSDIGIMPLPDTEWAKGKCGLKLLQYMSVGLPAVASPVGVNREIVRQGVNGFLAATEEEWDSTLTTLCLNAGLRVRVGREARRTVVDEFSLAAWGPRLAACYQGMVARPHALDMQSPVSKHGRI